ncbi:MAG: SUF system NifU family Fe-S cluster assembly protein [Candidatus Omnitrophota bacterium]|jgi:nitrogen fixation NifU-like protein
MSHPEPKLSHLYQEVILEHNRSPRNFKEIPNPTHYSHGHNALCGDDYHLYFIVDAGGVIRDVGFQGAGCAISKSSASMLTGLVKGKTVREALELKNRFVEFMTSDGLSAPQKEAVGRLALFEGVREFPVRVKCATLSWHALGDALKEGDARP